MSGQDKERMHIEYLPQAFARHRIVTGDDGNPLDYIFLEVNAAFEEMSGFSKDKILGEKASAILPCFKKDGFDWTSVYDKTNSDGDSVSYEQYLEPLDRWYEITDYSGDPGNFSLVIRDVTAKIKKEDLLHKNMLRFQFLVGSMPGGIVVEDDQRNIILTNRSFCEIFAIPAPPEAIVGSNCSNVAEEVKHLLAAPDQFPRRIEEIIENRQTIFGEEINFADGRVYERDYIPLFAEDQSFIGHMWQYRKITERKQADDALRESEENLRTTLNSIGDAVITTDKDGSITGMNPVAEKLTGWTEGEAQCRPLTDIFKIIYTRTRESVKNPVEQVLKKGEIIGLANYTLLISKSGTEHHIADSVAPIRDANGKISGVVLVFRDITEEYRLREALQDSEARYRSFVNNIPIGIYRNTPGPEGRFLMANPVFLDIFGIDNEKELLDLKVSDLYVEPNERKVFAAKVLEKNKVTGVELKLKKNDGTPIWCSVTAYVVYDKNKTIKYFDCALEDITDRKQAEENCVNMKSYSSC